MRSATRLRQIGTVEPTCVGWMGHGGSRGDLPVCARKAFPRQGPGRGTAAQVLPGVVSYHTAPIGTRVALGVVQEVRLTSDWTAETVLI